MRQRWVGFVFHDRGLRGDTLVRSRCGAPVLLQAHARMDYRQVGAENTPQVCPEVARRSKQSAKEQQNNQGLHPQSILLFLWLFGLGRSLTVKLRAAFRPSLGRHWTVHTRNRTALSHPQAFRSLFYLDRRFTPGTRSIPRSMAPVIPRIRTALAYESHT